MSLLRVRTIWAGSGYMANEHSFAKYMVREQGYTAGWLGKHLNSCPHEPPAGYDPLRASAMSFAARLMR